MTEARADEDVTTEEPAPRVAGGRRKAKRRTTGCIPVLVVLAVLVGLGWYGVNRGMGFIEEQFGDPDDYPGPGSGQVLFQVESGDTLTAMGQNLVEADVVASAEAFTDAASGDPDATGIQAGYYRLKEQMRASDVVDVLVDPANAVSRAVTIPEGYRVGQIVERVVAETKFTEKELTSLLDDPDRIGLPAEAQGNPEGYLYPATYPVTPGMTARSLLSQMVAQTEAVEQDLDVEGKASALGLTPHEVITVASILEYEADNAEDYAKVARVVYNRLDDGMLLQLDSTVSYVSKREGDVWTTEDERDSDSAYNTYKAEGLPPGPIGSPGEVSIEAALNPADGDWLFFVPDFENGTTLFADTYEEHQRNVAQAQEYCQRPGVDEC